MSNNRADAISSALVGRLESQRLPAHGDHRVHFKRIAGTLHQSPQTNGNSDFLPPLMLLFGVVAAFVVPGALPLGWVSLGLLVCLGLAWTLVRHSPALAMALAALAAATVGHQITDRFLTDHLSKLPTETDLDQAYKIRGRVLYQEPTDYGEALYVDQITILSPSKTAFALDRLTVYTPTLDFAAKRHTELVAWIRLKRKWEPRPFPWPMQRLREQYLPRFHGSVKAAELLEIKDIEVWPENGLNEGCRQLIDVLLRGKPSRLWSQRLAPFGLGHLLAISGLHCLLVYLGIQLLLIPLRRPMARALLTVLGLLAFAHWMGWSASVTRASLMLIAWHLVPLWNRRRSWLRLWTGLLLIGLLSNPLLFLMRGFWYTFAASLGLILGFRERDTSPLAHPWAARLRPFLPILSAQLMVLPIHLMFGCSGQLTSLFWNMLGFLALICLLILAAAALVATVMPAFLTIANGLEHATAQGLDLLARVSPNLELVRFPFHPETVLFVLTGLFLILKLGRREWRWYAALALSAGLLAWHRPLSGERLYMLDVGQGLCILYVDDEGAGHLFDCGGRTPPGVSISHITRLLGARYINGAFISHFNWDHYNLLTDFKGRFPVRVPQPQLVEFQRSPLLEGINFTGVSGGQIFRFGSVQVEVLWPPAELSAPNHNESSLMLIIGDKDWTFVFTGDAGIWAESRMTLPELLHKPVLQVGHHGSKSATDPTFIEKLEPSAALISCGRNNPFGHPHPRVLNLLDSAGVPIQTTSETGTLLIGKDSAVLPFR